MTRTSHSIPVNETPRTDSARISTPASAPLSCEHILEATEACFSESGYDGTTIRAIANKLGCSVGSIYRYFTDKRDLLRACAARVFSPVCKYLNAGAVSFDESLRMYLELVSRYPQMYRLMFWLESVSDAEHPARPKPIAGMIDAWADLLSSRTRAEHAWALTHGLIMLGMDSERIQQHLFAIPRPTPQPAASDDAEPDAAPSIEIIVATPPTAAREDVTLL